MTKAIVWSIAGSDSGSGAGIQADLLTCTNFGVHACTVITSSTAQNSMAVTDIEHISANHLQQQLQALHQDLAPCAIKIGMLGNNNNVKVVAEFIKNVAVPIVYDPILASSSGTSLLEDQAIQTIQNQLLPLATIITPNIPEAEQLSGITIRSRNDIPQAAACLLEQGAANVIIKGGHSQDEYAQDYWTNGKESFWLNVIRHPNNDTHGTGCTFSAAITSALALGYSLTDALVLAKMYVTQGICHAEKLGRGANLISHRGWPMQQRYIPTLHKDPLSIVTKTAFPSCGPEPLGFYPIVDSSNWVEKLLAIGIKTIQLRIKNLTGTALEAEISRAVTLANTYKARLFINDYWELALKYSAYGVHLGQEDLAAADLVALQHAKLRLGISTHNYTEVAIAHAIKPSYIAIGPIYPTTSKTMTAPAQGVQQLQRWCDTLNYPLVAIGGINEERLPEILATGVNGIAVISALTQAADPLFTAQHWMQSINQNRNLDLNLF